MMTTLISALLISASTFFSNHAPVIVLDPGHGGIDGGTSYGSILEKQLVLDIGLQLKYVLEKRGFHVEMTRSSDTDVSRLFTDRRLRSRHRQDLSNRARFSRENEATLFVSLHLNHSKNSNSSGAIVFYHVKDETSQQLAAIVQHALNEVTRQSIPPHKNDSFYVLKAAGCPAILIEYGFLSNPRERDRLVSANYRRLLAERTANAIASWLIQYRENNDTKKQGALRLPVCTRPATN